MFGVMIRPILIDCVWINQPKPPKRSAGGDAAASQCSSPVKEDSGTSGRSQENTATGGFPENSPKTWMISKLKSGHVRLESYMYEICKPRWTIGNLRSKRPVVSTCPEATESISIDRMYKRPVYIVTYIHIEIYILHVRIIYVYITINVYINIIYVYIYIVRITGDLQSLPSCDIAWTWSNCFAANALSVVLDASFTLLFRKTVIPGFH